jgi:apolipoprotein D and lipocalin family protein
MKPVSRLPAILFLFAAALAAPAAARAQSATPIPKLDTNQFIAKPWYVLERYPIKRQKACLGTELNLYALGDKKNTFQLVTSCAVKQDNTTAWNFSGKLDPAGSGALKLTHLLIFHSPYWVIATAPDYAWMLVGTPNHHSLWILSHTKTLPPDTLTAITAKAAAEGYDTSRLIHIPQP